MEATADSCDSAVSNQTFIMAAQESFFQKVEHWAKRANDDSYLWGASPLSVALFHLVGLTSMVLVLLLVRYNNRRRKSSNSKLTDDTTTNQPTKPSLKRTVSFTSYMLANTAMPKRVNYPDATINATLFFDTCPSTEDVIQDIVVQLLQYERMANVPVLSDKGRMLTFEPPSKPLEMARLVRRVEVDCDTDGLYEAIRAHIHDPVSGEQRKGLPWWEILILDNKGSGQSVMMWRIHHAIGDGISLATVVQHILKNVDGSPMGSIIPKGMMEKRQKGMHQNGNTNDNDNKPSWYTMAYKLVSATVQLLVLPWMYVDQPTVFSKHMNLSMTHTRHRDLVIFPTMPLAFVKAVKNAASVTINDVLFTCLSQAIHDYLKQQDCPVLKQKQEKLLCRAMIAAVLPRKVNTIADTLVNKWFLLSSDMGVGSDYNQDILRRLQFIHNHLNQLKHSPLPFVGLAMQNYLAPWFPTWLNEQYAFRSLASHSLCISNVPGPAQTCVAAKQPVRGVQISLSNLIPHVGLISYSDFVFGNMCVDPEAVPDCQSLGPLYGKAMIALAERLEVPVPEEVIEAVKSASAKYAAAAKLQNRDL